MVVSLAGLNYFMPIASFLLVAVLVYALIIKTGILGENKAIALFISLILAVFFIVNASLVEFVEFSSAWFIVFLVCVFFIVLLISFTHKNVEAIMKPKVAWAILIALIVFFIISSAYVFNWAVNWAMVWDWFYTDWFGMVLLIVIAALVSWVLTKK